MATQKIFLSTKGLRNLWPKTDIVNSRSGMFAHKSVVVCSLLPTVVEFTNSRHTRILFNILGGSASEKEFIELDNRKLRLRQIPFLPT